MLTLPPITKQIRPNGFDDFIKSEKTVLVRLHDGEKENGRPDIDERIRKYFAGEYGRSVAFGSLDTSEVFPKDLWLGKHLGSFAEKGSGYYLASKGKLIAFHPGELVRADSPSPLAGKKVRADSPSPLAAKLMESGHPGKAFLLTVLEGFNAGVGADVGRAEQMPSETAQAIIEDFERALGKLPISHEERSALT